ncbi:MAG: polysaccharide deacetylase [Lachnospiraceae bacterium]|nr:polysaccharide deacetylase [Lachnospiraceae bacterium]
MGRYEEEALPKSRQERVERLKKILVTIVLLLVFIPIVTSICLTFAFVIMNHRLEEARDRQSALEEQIVDLQFQLLESRQKQAEAESALGQDDPVEIETVSESENGSQDVQTEDGIKRVYLTFDDGPSRNTEAILDLLAEYDVKATFFVVGNTDEEAKAIYRRIVNEGHTIGIHSYSHRYSNIYASQDAFLEDFYLLSDYIYDVTGVRPDICRLPGGSSNTVSRISMSELVRTLDSRGITCYDWNISGGDADGHGLSAGQITNNVLNGVDRFQTSIVLLHDGADKYQTVDALEKILQELSRREDLEMGPITEDTPIILHIKY